MSYHDPLQWGVPRLPKPRPWRSPSDTVHAAVLAYAEAEAHQHLSQLEGQCRAAVELQRRDRLDHLVLVYQATADRGPVGMPPAVASTWPDPWGTTTATSSVPVWPDD